MKYVRFMGMDELHKYLSGETLINNTVWSDKAQRTGSVGFCFFDDSVAPESRMHYLNGVVDMEVVAVFEPVVPMCFVVSEGKYRNPEKPIPAVLFEAFLSELMMPVKEYSLTEYSCKTLQLVKVGVPVIGLSEYRIEWITVDGQINSVICRQ